MSSDKKDNTNDKNTTRKETGKVANLKVAEVAEHRDVGRKIVRIDPDIAERLNIHIDKSVCLYKTVYVKR
jgi:hypothetical protein